MGYVIFLILFVLGLNGIFDFFIFLLKPKNYANWVPPFGIRKDTFLIVVGLIVFVIFMDIVV